MIFRDECKTCIITFVDKIWERSPLKYPLTKGLTCLNLEFIVSDNNIIKKLEDTLEIVVNSNLLASSVADQVQREYNNLFNKQGTNKKMAEFPRETDRLDHFWMRLLGDG